MKHRPPANRSTCRWIALLVIVAVSAGVVAVWYRPAPPRAEAVPPDVALGNVSARIAGVIQTAREKVLAEPASAAAWGQLGMTLYAHRFSAEAVQCLDEAARLAPGDYPWPYLAGMIVAEDDVSAGIGAILRAAELAPGNDAVHLRAGELLFDLGRIDDSERWVKPVIARDPGNARAQLGMARIAYARNNAIDALGWAEKAARGAPDHPEPLQMLARIHQQAGQAAAAQSAADRLAQLPKTVYRWPDPVLAQVEQLRTDRARLTDTIKTLVAQQRVAEAVELINRMAAEEPDSPQPPQLLAHALLRGGNPEMAAEVLDKALARLPQAGELLYLRGIIHAGFGEFDRAEAALKQAIAQKPDHVEALFLLANTYREMKRPEDSIRVFRDTLALEPMYAPAHINLAEVLLNAGQRQEALEHLRTARRLSPDSPKLQQLWQQAEQR